MKKIMKKIISTLLVFIKYINSYTLKAQDITFPDQWMRANMFSNYNAFDSLGNGIVINQNGDNAIQQSEALRVYTLRLGYTNSIQSLEGIQYFSNLRELEFIGSSMTDLSILNSLTDLRVLKCYNNTQLTTLNVSNFPKLKTLLCYGCKIAALDVSNLTSLETLDCKNNNLTSLNITNCTKLKQLSCENNQITSLNASNLSNIETMTCQNNKLVTLTINGNNKLQTMNCSNNLITSLDANNLVNLKSLNCSKNKLNSLTLLH